MDTLLESETLKKYEQETNDYIAEKKIDKLLALILKNVLYNQPKNVYRFIYKNIYSFLLIKVFIIGPPLLNITSTLSSTIASLFNCHYISTYHLVKSYISKNEQEDEGEAANKVLVNDSLVSSLVKETVKSSLKQKRRGYVIEGYPRNNIQAKDCLKFVPTHVIVLYGDENYIYKKYEEENNTNIFSQPTNTLLTENTKTMTKQKNVYTEKEKIERKWGQAINREKRRGEETGKGEIKVEVELEENSTPLFEMAEINPKPLRDKVNFYLRNISGVIDISGVLKDGLRIFDLSQITEEKLIETVKHIVQQYQTEWNICVEEPLDQKKTTQQEENNKKEQTEEEKEKETETETEKSKAY